MVTIRQHGNPGILFDLKDFILDLESWQRRVDYWIIQIEECSAPNGLALAELTSGNPSRLSPVAFSSLCYDMSQTIDGEFVAYIDGREVIRLLAVDSSYWEITGPPEFEKHMLAKYGAYENSYAA